MASNPYPEGMHRQAALMAVGSAIPVLQRAYRAAGDKAVAHTGVSQALAWPLVMIGRQGEGVRQGVLAEWLGIEAPSLVRSLDQLVDAGFIKRREDAMDRRAKTLHLTAAGASACAEIETALQALRTEVYEGVPDEDIAACLRVFRVLEQRLGCPVMSVPRARASAPDADAGKPRAARR
ncbi:MarR family winged helix-turn-helix transcriptional regulator [Paracidovorax wautersii]|uniref:Transcriptional regulator, MarR family n=1 Tax=Paracidovorax wautersii TaxID=1177982 RepID=A0A1I2EQ35_9BURK|nr:MarR family transcriptional regulator [Paracidovorax wautersii]SFE95142.1 transcriptional regulator, MarR family [Paracidovorax wautersii]